MSSPGRAPGGLASDFEYELSSDRIARHPVEQRDESRLLTVPPEPAPFGHRRFREVVELFRPGDVLVVNDSRVLPVRLLGLKPTGAPAEILLVRPWIVEGGLVSVSPGLRAASECGVADLSGALPASLPEMTEAAATATLWEALVRPGGKLKPGRTVVVAPDFQVEILDSLPGGMRLVRLVTPLLPGEALERHGHVPLPPYIDREDEAQDRERYQTVYATAPGSVAAPTAGLHFTRELLDQVRAAQVEVATIQLHVGVGTFRPVDTDDPAHHEMHSELYRIPEDAAAAIERARAGGGRVWAVGTTVVRALETVALEDGRIEESMGSTRLFIRPPFRFRVVDGLITNFHLPRSTLLMLVAAFAGYPRTMSAYREAVDQGYRFYSYGDAMALWRGESGAVDPPPRVGDIKRL